MKVSIIIPARNEEYLEKTIRNILENATGEIEVIAMLDGYIPDPQIVIDDDRVQFHYLPESIGQRAAINEGVRRSTGEFIMKLDAHCALAKGFDEVLSTQCGKDILMVPRMYNLDVENWQPKWHKRTDYMLIENVDGCPRMAYFDHSPYRHQPDNNLMIDETMCILGACFFMDKETYWKWGGCDERHGGWGQQGVEMACKAWLSGGKLLVNKNTWFAHYFRGGSGPGFPYPLSGKDVDIARAHSIDLWLNNKWELQKYSFKWLLNKFGYTDTWEEYMNDTISDDKLQEIFYHRVHLKGNDPRWKGLKLIKLPSDLTLYQEAIFENKPDFIVEIGTAFCASAVFMADICEIIGHGQVITIDPSPRGPLIKHPRITYLKGDSKSKTIINKVKKLVGDKSVMLSIDGNHKRQQVKWELKLYKDIVTVGQYMVVEDCYGRHGELVGPGEARDWFFKWNRQYKNTNLDKKYIVGFTKGGWLKRVK